MRNCVRPNNGFLQKTPNSEQENKHASSDEYSLVSFENKHDRHSVAQHTADK